MCGTLPCRRLSFARSQAGILEVASSAVRRDPSGKPARTLRPKHITNICPLGPPVNLAPGQLVNGEYTGVFVGRPSEIVDRREGQACVVPALELDAAIGCRPRRDERLDGVGADRAPGNVQVVRGLQVEPEDSRRAQRLADAQGRVRRHRPAAVDDLVDAAAGMPVVSARRCRAIPSSVRNSSRCSPGWVAWAMGVLRRDFGNVLRGAGVEKAALSGDRRAGRLPPSTMPP